MRPPANWEDIISPEKGRLSSRSSLGSPTRWACLRRLTRGIFTRCPNHLSWLLSKQRSHGSTPRLRGCLSSETLSLKLGVDILWQKLKQESLFFLSIPTAHGNRWWLERKWRDNLIWSNYLICPLISCSILPSLVNKVPRYLTPPLGFKTPNRPLVGSLPFSSWEHCTQTWRGWSSSPLLPTQLQTGPVQAGGQSLMRLRGPHHVLKAEMGYWLPLLHGCGRNPVHKSNKNGRNEFDLLLLLQTEFMLWKTQNT